MGRRSISESPLTKLRQLLEPPMTIKTFAEKHGISFDTLKKIESSKTQLVLGAEGAMQLALQYGVEPDCLCQKFGPLLAMGGKQASRESIELWRKMQGHLGSVRRELAFAAARQVLELFMSVPESELTCLGLSLESWKREAIKATTLQRDLSAGLVFRKVRNGVLTISEIERFLGFRSDSDNLGRNKSWRHTKAASSTSLIADVYAARLFKPLIEIETIELSSELAQPGNCAIPCLIVNKTSRLVKVVVGSGKKKEILSERGRMVQIYPVSGGIRRISVKYVNSVSPSTEKFAS